MNKKERKQDNRTDSGTRVTVTLKLLFLLWQLKSAMGRDDKRRGVGSFSFGPVKSNVASSYAARIARCQVFDQNVQLFVGYMCVVHGPDWTMWPNVQ